MCRVVKLKLCSWYVEISGWVAEKLSCWQIFRGRGSKAGQRRTTAGQIYAMNDFSHIQAANVFLRKHVVVGSHLPTTPSQTLVACMAAACLSDNHHLQLSCY